MFHVAIEEDLRGKRGLRRKSRLLGGIIIASRLAHVFAGGLTLRFFLGAGHVDSDLDIDFGMQSHAHVVKPEA